MPLIQSYSHFTAFTPTLSHPQLLSETYSDSIAAAKNCNNCLDESIGANPLAKYARMLSNASYAPSIQFHARLC